MNVPGCSHFNEIAEVGEGDRKLEVVIGIGVPQLPGLNGRGGIHRECEGGVYAIAKRGGRQRYVSVRTKVGRNMPRN